MVIKITRIKFTSILISIILFELFVKLYNNILVVYSKNVMSTF